MCILKGEKGAKWRAKGDKKFLERKKIVFKKGGGIWIFQPAVKK